MEMGGDFAFLGNQYRLEIGQEEFYIDLLLYHRRLRSLIVVELKTGKFKAEYAGKMQLYLTALNETVKTAEENSSIGIIICKQKDRTVVEYALKDMNSPMGVATYTIKEELPEYMKELLPSPEAIAKSLESIEWCIAQKKIGVALLRVGDFGSVKLHQKLVTRCACGTRPGLCCVKSKGI